MSTSTSSYADCVASLQRSLSYLESSVDTLGNGVSDFPRLTSVLKTVRVRFSGFTSASKPRLAPAAPLTATQHYELIPSTTLAAAEASLRSEIGPSIALLLDRADAQLDRQARRVETLKARAELQAGRLSHGPADDRDHDGGAAAARGRTLDGEAALRARMVRQKKEALKYSVERMELEVGQKGRELRARLETT